MARVGGRNLAISWLAGILCAGIVVALIWFSIPILPTLATVVGESIGKMLP